MLDHIVCLQLASERLGVGVTTLKRSCRANNMDRFRTRKSLGNLIERTKQALDDGTGHANMQKLAGFQVLGKQKAGREGVSFLLMLFVATGDGI